MVQMESMIEFLSVDVQETGLIVSFPSVLLNGSINFADFRYSNLNS